MSYAKRALSALVPFLTLIFLALLVASCGHVPDAPASEEPPQTGRSWQSYTTGAVAASARGAAQRVIVVDDNDQVIEIWSNTTGEKRGYYFLRVREGSLQGEAHPKTQEILDQYKRLLSFIDWNKTGRVWTTPE